MFDVTRFFLTGRKPTYVHDRVQLHFDRFTRDQLPGTVIKAVRITDKALKGSELLKV